MLIETLLTLYTRDLSRLKKEIDSYENDQSLWQVWGEIPNSGGNLCLHLLGNLNTYIGAILGNTGYVRNRENEFALKNTPKTELIDEIDKLTLIIQATLSKMEDKDLVKEYPLVVFEDKMTTGFFLVHLACHLTYHLGQINYHRRGGLAMGNEQGGMGNEQ